VDPCRSITVNFRAIIARASSQTVPTSVTNLQNIIRGHSTRNATVPQQVNGVLISHHQCTARLDASFSVGNYIPEAKVHNTLGAASIAKLLCFLRISNHSRPLHSSKCLHSDAPTTPKCCRSLVSPEHGSWHKIEDCGRIVAIILSNAARPPTVCTEGYNKSTGIIIPVGRMDC
jgi:hypothetical protein